MLATSGRPAGGLTGFAVEPKYDGWRAAVTLERGALAVRTRNGRLITDCVPELQPIAAAGQTAVLDGELIVGAGRLTDFYRLSGRLAGKPRAGSEAVVFAAFDVLWLDGDLLTGRPYTERRSILAQLDLGPAHVVPSYDAESTDDLLAACEANGMEGVILKGERSIYKPGKRSGDWRKIKGVGWRDHQERRRPR